MTNRTFQPMTLDRACLIAAKAHNMTPDDREFIEQGLLKELRDLGARGDAAPSVTDEDVSLLSRMLVERNPYILNADFAAREMLTVLAAACRDSLNPPDGLEASLRYERFTGTDRGAALFGEPTAPDVTDNEGLDAAYMAAVDASYATTGGSRWDATSHQTRQAHYAGLRAAIAASRSTPTGRAQDSEPSLSEKVARGQHADAEHEKRQRERHEPKVHLPKGEPRHGDIQ